MNFTNINDPAGVKALLEQLRASQAWQDVVQTPPENVPQPAPGPSSGSTSSATTQSSSSTSDQAVHSSTAANLAHDPSASLVHSPGSDLLADSSGHPLDAPSPSVASLLSQLQSSSTPPPRHVFTPISSTSSSLPLAPAPPFHSSATEASAAPTTGLPVPRLSSARKDDLRNLTFQQALPHLAQLAEDPGFVDAISTMRRDQTDLERQLWDERRAILSKHEEKVKVARIKATLVGGTGLTQYEADVRLPSNPCARLRAAADG
ncbi:hypothetical protein EVJ58_g6344 [Rhodofomes roseus]|uniref:Uncharacterized protein n=1 Tax=Rhodofomes roseus TaxID=34475 RepID=A0A4Y9Y970_9APHY|nr:hypothetical protein EVJ58_g6344 [Rhodofomes roseus]